MYKIFVYGTLKRGHLRDFVLEDSTFLGEATSLPQFSMLDLGIFPALVPGNTSIKGELWGVDDLTLAELDQIEGHPRFYQRQPYIVKVGEESLEAWIYTMATDPQGNFATIDDGNWPDSRP